MSEAGRFCYSHPRPSVTVDTVVFAPDAAGLKTLLIRRLHEPFQGQWAFPGGFVDPNEPLDAAAARELAEETGIEEVTLWTVGMFGDPGRDPRGWTISAAFYALVPQEQTTVRAGDDAAEAAWKPVDQLPPLAFDHAHILDCALTRLRHELYIFPVARSVLRSPFTLTQLSALHHIIDPAVSEESNASRRLLDAGVIVDSGPAGIFSFGAESPK